MANKLIYIQYTIILGNDNKKISKKKKNEQFKFELIYVKKKRGNGIIVLKTFCTKFIYNPFPPLFLFKPMNIPLIPTCLDYLFLSNSFFSSPLFSSSRFFFLPFLCIIFWFIVSMEEWLGFYSLEFGEKERRRKKKKS